MDTIFTSPTGDGTAVFTWSSEPRECSAACSAKRLPSFFSYFKTPSNGPAPGIEPATSRSPIELIPPVQSETQNNVKFQNMYTEILLYSTDEYQPLDTIKSITTL